MSRSLADETGFVLEENGSAMVVAAGSAELDVAIAPLLRRALETALRASPTVLVTDLTGVEFLDSATIGEFVRAADTAEDSGIRLVLVADTPAVTRPVTLVGLDRRIPLYPTRAQALESA